MENNKTLVEQVDLEIGFETPPVSAASTFWNDIHPSITRLAKVRYEAHQFADCVEAALPISKRHGCAS
jgi:hypothetical protein